MNNMSEFSRYGMETIKVAGAIVLGIIFGFSLPQAWFNALQHRQNGKAAMPDASIAKELTEKQNGSPSALIDSQIHRR